MRWSDGQAFDAERWGSAVPFRDNLRFDATRRRVHDPVLAAQRLPRPRFYDFLHTKIREAGLESTEQMTASRATGTRCSGGVVRSRRRE